MTKKYTNTVIIGAFAGPGCGKSTFCGNVFGQLKQMGYNVEYVQEFAKTLTWEKNFEALKHQPYVTGVQQYSQNMLLGQVEAVITDSPLLIGLMYYQEPDMRVKEAFEKFVIESFNSQYNMNFLLKRTKEYNTSGRNQTESEAVEIDQRVESLLKNNGIPYTEITGDAAGTAIALKKITEYLDTNRKAYDE